jgi:serine/threonine protein phosphatase PrpC
MWKMVFASTTGTSHDRSAQPCQDYGVAQALQTDHETVLVAACADGAGSAKHSELGSRLACESILRLVCDSFIKGLKSQEINRDHFLEWHRIVLGELEREAEAYGAGARELACTLLTAVVGESFAAFSQIGDGAIIISWRDSYDCVFWPQSGNTSIPPTFLPTGTLRITWKSGCKKRE